MMMYPDLCSGDAVPGRDVGNSSLYHHFQDGNDIHSVCYPSVLRFSMLLRLPAKF
jgi:hypothetical protein